MILEVFSNLNDSVILLVFPCCLIKLSLSQPMSFPFVHSPPHPTSVEGEG